MNKEELNDKHLAQVSGGKQFALTDEMIKKGDYLVGMADTISYNDKVYYDQHQTITINQVNMYVYKSSDGASLLVPHFNYC